MGGKTAAVNPYMQAGMEGAGLVTDIIGMIVSRNDMLDAQDEARTLDRRDFAAGEERNAFSEKMSNEGLKLSKSADSLAKNRFALDSMATGYTITKDQAQKAIDLLNSNNALKDRVLRNWSM